MVIACLLVLLFFWPLGLGALVLPWVGLCWGLWQFSPAALTARVEPVWLMLFAASVPLCAGLSVVLVERISGLGGGSADGLRSARQVSALSSMVLLASHQVWIEVLFQGMNVTASHPGSGIALLLAFGNTIVFCVVLSALSVTVVQYLMRWGIACGFRMSTVKLALPWTAITVLGAVAIAALLGQQIGIFFWQECNPGAMAHRIR